MKSKALLQSIKKLASTMSGDAAGDQSVCSRLNYMRDKIKDPTKRDDPKTRVNKSLKMHKCAIDRLITRERIAKLHADHQKAASEKVGKPSFDVPSSIKEAPSDVKLAAADLLIAALSSDIKQSTIEADDRQ